MNDRSASLAEVAKTANVARSTLHRYFPERSDLLEAVSAYSRDQMEGIADRARFHEGPLVEAMVRMALEYFEHWDAMMWSYMDSQQEGGGDGDEIDLQINARLQEGQKSGEIDASMPAEWYQHVMYALVYSAWEYERNGHTHAEAALLVMTAMRKLLAPPIQPIVPPVITG